jgi:hypothetical protein
VVGSCEHGNEPLEQERTLLHKLVHNLKHCQSSQFSNHNILKTGCFLYQMTVQSRGLLLYGHSYSQNLNETQQGFGKLQFNKKKKKKKKGG